MLKKTPPIADNSSVRKVCIDDFALRKRYSYGTVMVNLENHKIVDMIPSRDTCDVKAWLIKYPNIEIVSRGGCGHIPSPSDDVNRRIKSVVYKKHKKE